MSGCFFAVIAKLSVACRAPFPAFATRGSVYLWHVRLGMAPTREIFSLWPLSGHMACAAPSRLLGMICLPLSSQKAREAPWSENYRPKYCQISATLVSGWDDVGKCGLWYYILPLCIHLRHGRWNIWFNFATCQTYNKFVDSNFPWPGERGRIGDLVSPFPRIMAFERE